MKICALRGPGRMQYKTLLALVLANSVLHLLLHNPCNIIGIHQMIIAIHVGVTGHAGITVAIRFAVGEELVACLGVDHIITGAAGQRQGQRYCRQAG